MTPENPGQAGAAVDSSCGECGSGMFAAGSTMPGICPECAHWLYGYAPCQHSFVVGPGKRYCRTCGWDGARSQYVQRLIDGGEADWLEAVPITSLEGSEAQFTAWLQEHDMTSEQLSPQDLRVEVGRWDKGSFARYFVRRSAVVDSQAKEGDIRPWWSCPGLVDT